MSENNPSKLPIDQVYTVLKKMHSTYQAKYASLNKKNSVELLTLVKRELASSEGLMQQLNSDIQKGLINPNFKNKADELVRKINKKQTVTSGSIKQQFDEFIDLSELLFWSCTGWNISFNSTILQNFAFLTKLKFNLFLANLNYFLVTSEEKSGELVRIAEILINDYFPAVANASYDLLAQGILLLYNTDVNALKEAIENTDVFILKIRLVCYKNNISAQKETFISAQTSENDDEDYYSCYEFNVVENSDGSDSSDNDSYYLSEDEDEDEDEFFDAPEHPVDESLPSKAQNKYSIQRLVQSLINSLKKLIHSLGHFIHRAEKNSPSLTLSTAQEIEPIDRSDTTSTPPIGLGNPTHPPILPSVNDWNQQKNTHSRRSNSIDNVHNFHQPKKIEENNGKTVPKKTTMHLLRTLSTPF